MMGLDKILEFRRDQSGVTLVEMAVVIGIISMSIFVTVSVIQPIENTARYNATKLNMQKIAMVLAAYAQHNNRIPCPGEPNTTVTTQPRGMEVGSGASGITVPNVRGNASCRNGATNFNEGIVPYATLGITRSDVLDGWGNLITYRVSPAFAIDSSAAATSVALAHARCRTAYTWMYGDGTAVSGAYNRDGPKARFCCPDTTMIASDIVVQDTAGVRLVPITRDSTGGNYASVNTATTTTSFDPVARNVTAVAYVLVSHGANGAGAYTSTGTRLSTSATTGTAEDENKDGDNIFVYADFNSSNTTSHYDDIVKWYTQDAMYSSQGNLSCQIP
ncbi:MAG: type II secretion system protein [Alphaproteobacteria bacterium]